MSVIPDPPPLLPPTTNMKSPAAIIKDFEDTYYVTLCNLEQFKHKYITKIIPIPQTGPNCGLAALAMVATLTPSSLSVNGIFKEARSRGFTHNGEMFSALNMKTLTESMLAPWFTVEVFSNGLTNNRTLVINKLNSGGLMLIAYDADKNHSPCCKNGHKAHWALVCGVMELDDGEVFVAARHGKSRYLAVWSFDSLQQSNDNLFELDPDKESDNEQYMLPPGGVREGLASKFILLTKKSDCS